MAKKRKYNKHLGLVVCWLMSMVIGLDVCVKDTVEESHAGDINHGDVCRRKDNDFVCPNGCTALPTAPFCMKGNLTAKSKYPCRALSDLDSPCQNSYKLEMHSTTPNHGNDAPFWVCCSKLIFNPPSTHPHISNLVAPCIGDICRSNGKSTFVCPFACSLQYGEPYCISGHEQDGDPIPCRIRFNATKMITSTFATRTPEKPNEIGICDHGEGSAMKKDAVLVRFTFEHDHGDICREEANKEGSFFCPKGCVHLSSPPYCADGNASFTSSSSDNISKLLSPCRVPLVTISRLDRLLARVHQLMESRNRLTHLGDEEGARGADLKLRLVKHELKKEKQSIARAKITNS